MPRPGHTLLLALVAGAALAGCGDDAAPPERASYDGPARVRAAVEALDLVPGGRFRSEVRLTGSSVVDRGTFSLDPSAVAFSRRIDDAGGATVLRVRVVGADSWLLVASTSGRRTPAAARCWVHLTAAQLSDRTGLDLGTELTGLPAAVAVALEATGRAGDDGADGPDEGEGDGEGVAGSVPAPGSLRASTGLYPVAQMLGSRFAGALGLEPQSAERLDIDLDVEDGAVSGWSTSVAEIASAASGPSPGAPAAPAAGSIVASIEPAASAPGIVPPRPRRTVELGRGVDALADAAAACTAARGGP